MLAERGVDPDWMIGRHLWDEVCPGDDSELGRLLRRAMVERVPLVAESYYPPYQAWYQTRLDPLADGGIANYFRDITLQKQADETQRRLQRERDELLERLHLQFERIPIACILFDAAHRIVEWNPAAEATFGWSRQEVLGREGLSVLAPTPVPETLQRVLERLDNGEMDAHSVNENVTRDGCIVVCEWDNTPLHDADGKVVGFLSTAQDVTRRREAEAALLDTQERLAADLAAMTRLQQVSTRLVPAAESTALLLEIVDTAIAVTAADKGHIQLLEPESELLRIVASRGFEPRFLEFFRTVSRGVGSCGTAMREGSRVIVEDVDTSPVLAGSPALEALRAAGVRAVQSTPLVARSGRLVGMLSTHCMLPHRPSDHDLGLLDLLARQAADWIERTQAEQALQASEERFRRYFELGLIGMAITMPDQGVLEVNDRLCEILGYDRSELLRVTWSDITHPDDLAADEGQFRRVLAGEIDSYSIDKRWIRKDGGVVHTEISVNCIRRPDRSVDYFIALVQDITWRKRAEAALRESEERYRSLISQVRDYAIFSADERGIVTSWNEGCQQVLGYEEDEFLGLNSAALFSPDDRAAEVPAQQLRRATERGASRMQRWMVGKSGRRFFAMGTTTALTDPGRGLLGFSMVLRDFTQMKLRQDELTRRGESLARLVSEQTDALQRTTERLRLSERMASLGTLAAGLGHDLGNLLLPIDIRLKLLLDAELTPQLRAHVDGIQKGTRYLQQLAGGLRSLAVDPETSLDGEATELRRWWDDVALIFRNLLRRGTAFEHELPAADCWVAMKPVSLTQVVFNLVQNAADALTEREAAIVRVTVADTGEGSFVRLQVSDSGSGMSAEVIRRCMEPYFSTKPRGVSTGMGLSFVHRLVTGVGGRVDIASAAGQGTTVTLTLPRAQPS